MNNLKNYVNWKLTHADKTAEAEGYPLVLENCKANKRMKQLEIYGNSVQDGTPTPDNPIEVGSVGEKSVNLFDVDTYPLTVGACIWGNTGNASDYSYPQCALTVDYIPCADLRGKDITINHTLGSSVGGGFYDENKTFISGFQYKNATSKTITVPDTAFYYRFSVDANYIDEIQVQEGSTVTPYEPYGKYKIPVVQRGVNLFSMSMVNATAKTINGITFTPLDDERVHIKGKAIDNTVAVNYQCGKKGTTSIPKGIYRAKPNKYVWSGSGFSIQFGVSNGVTGKNINAIASSVEITMDNAYLNYAQIYISGAALNKEYDDIIEWQLMKGTKNLPYEPYIEPVTTNIFLDEPLRKIGDYADYIDFKENKVVRTIKEHIITGAETILPFGGSYPYSVINIGDVGYVIDDICLCNSFAHQSNFSVSREGINTFRVLNSYSNNASRIGFRLYVDGAILNDENIVKPILKDRYQMGTPVIFYYGLSEPFEEFITIELPKLTAKTTIIEVDTSLLPGNMYGKYIKR